MVAAVAVCAYFDFLNVFRRCFEKEKNMCRIVEHRFLGLRT
jgi:hypothetical protein